MDFVQQIGEFMSTKDKLKNMSGILLMACCFVVFAVIAADVDLMVVLLVLGVLDLLYGLFMYFVNGADLAGKCMIVTGAYIVVMGILNLTNLFETRIYWQIFAGGLCIIALYGVYILRKSKKK